MMFGRVSRSVFGCPLLLLCLAAVTAQSNNQQIVVEQIRVATEKAERGDISGARADVLNVLAKNQDSAAAWYELGSVLGQAADFRGAEEAFRRAIQLDGKLTKAHLGLALTLIANPQDKQDWQGAIAECREVLRYEPGNVEAMNLLGTGLLTIGQTGESIQVLVAAIRLSPALAKAHFNLALALEKNDQLEESAKEYTAAIAAKPNYPEAVSAYGKLLVRQGKTVEAQREFESALNLNPDLADAHYNLAIILRAKDAGAAAIEFAEFSDLIARRPNAVQSAQLSNQGLETAGQGDYAKAIALLGQAIALKPEYGPPHFNLGLVFAADGKTAEAIQALEKAISLMPSEYKTWLNLGRVLRRANNFDEAYHALTWAAQLSPKDPAIKAELDSLRSSDPGRFEKLASIGEPRRPDVGAASETADAHFRFGEMLNERGDFEGAEGEQLRALSLDPRMWNARRLLAEEFEKLSKNDRALLEYYKLLKLNEHDGSTHLAIGKLLLARGETGSALVHLQKAVEYSPGDGFARTALQNAEKLATKP
jgi:tetratricopeptide (TPR) repeat protein